MDKSLSEGEIKNFLRDLQLTDYEIKVYVSLLKYGPQNYKELTKRSSVPYGKIYYILKSLSRKGWIKSINGRPRVFHATDPKEPLQNHLVKIKEQINELEDLFHRMIPQLQKLYHKSNHSELP